jgi:cytoskeletal protein RodZ
VSKLIVFAVIGLVVGIGGGSGVAVMRAKKTIAAAADSTAKKDSASVGEKKPGDADKPPKTEGTEPTAAPKVDSTTTVAQVAPAKHDSVAATPSVAPHAPTVAPALPVPATAIAAARPAGVDTGRAGTPPSPGRIAKIFGAMSSKDAARVLQQLDDSDVQTVLSGLNDKQAAAILAGFPPERAASISRAALRGKKGAS